MVNWLISGAVLISSYLLTGVMLKYAQHQYLIDIPNERSSHSVPIPRGGGVSIVFTFLLALFFLYFSDHISKKLLMAFWGGGILIAMIGFVDDHRHITPSWRITFHFIAVAWALFCLGGFPPFEFGGVSWNLGWFGNIFGLIFLVWLLNLFNFMDGIDGIATIEAITIAGSAGIIMYYKKATSEPFLLFLLMIACFGFLIWNWPPAKIFMGDVGSGFLGFVLGVFIIHTTAGKFLTFWTWLILLGIFLVDATITLLRRILTKQRWHEAHRSHAYQWAARRFNSHEKVTLAVLGINVLWLLPLAWCSNIFPTLGLLFTIISYLPLIYIALKFKAGIEEIRI